MPRAGVLRALMSQLASASGKTVRALRSSIRGVWWHNWDRDPYARGAYSYLRVGASVAPKMLAKPERQTLFFAGEATQDERGTVEAALASGRRAARQVLRTLSRR